MIDVLVAVDLQNDFIDGALGTKEALAIVENAKKKIKAFPGPVFFTRDTHAPSYLETEEGKHLPVPHCIKGTKGWEIREELDSKIKIEKLICTTDYDYPGFHLTMDVYLASLIEGRLTLLEHEDAKWVSLDDIDALDWLPADWSVIEEIKRHFRNSL